MPTAKPKYDEDGRWKHRQYDEAEWETVKKALRGKLRPFFPDKDAPVDPFFGHPADEWANLLLNEAWSAVSMTLWLRRRLTNAELRAERTHLLTILKKCARSLSAVSHDLQILIEHDADILGCRDKINELLPHILASGARIKQLPRANRPREAQHAAAVQMAISVLRVLKQYDTQCANPITATADGDAASNAVKILKTIGDEIALALSEVTWKDIIGEARKTAPDLDAANIPRPKTEPTIKSFWPSDFDPP